MPRLLFTKTGDAVWMSHLDLMRLMQRAFKRAGLPLKHTQGYNPRPSVSIAMPLSVGVESLCELLDFELDGAEVANDEIMTRLNGSLVDGIRVRSVYDNGGKIKDLTHLSCVLTMEYDRCLPSRQETQARLAALFSRDSLVVDKKSKNGMVEQDIIPLMKDVHVQQQDPHTLEIRAVICCQNPSMNPMQIAAAVQRYEPDLAPDFVKCRRIENLDASGREFR